MSVEEPTAETAGAGSEMTLLELSEAISAYRTNTANILKLPGVPASARQPITVWFTRHVAHTDFHCAVERAVETTTRVLRGTTNLEALMLGTTACQRCVGISDEHAATFSRRRPLIDAYETVDELVAQLCANTVDPDVEPTQTALAALPAPSGGPLDGHIHHVTQIGAAAVAWARGHRNTVAYDRLIVHAAAATAAQHADPAAPLDATPNVDGVAELTRWVGAAAVERLWQHTRGCWLAEHDTSTGQPDTLEVAHTTNTAVTRLTGTCTAGWRQLLDDIAGNPGAENLCVIRVGRDPQARLWTRLAYDATRGQQLGTALGAELVMLAELPARWLYRAQHDTDHDRSAPDGFEIAVLELDNIDARTAAGVLAGLTIGCAAHDWSRLEELWETTVAVLTPAAS